MFPQKNIFVRYRVVNNQSYLINKGEAFILDDVGVTVWENINGEKSTDDIIVEIAKKFNKQPDEIKEDITGYIKDLKKNGLVKAV